MNEESLFSISTLVFISCLFDDGSSKKWDVICQYGFHLHSLMTRDFEHLFMYLLPFCVSSLDKCSGLLFIFKLCFFVVCFLFLLLSYMSYLYILNINPLSGVCFINICFSYSVGFLFTLIFPPHILKESLPQLYLHVPFIFSVPCSIEFFWNIDMQTYSSTSK